MKVKIKKLHPDAQIPRRATDGSAGYDLFLPADYVLKPGRQVAPLGLAIEMPPGYEAKIEARSGYESKGMEARFASSLVRIDADVLTGKIDSDYRQEIGVIIKANINKSTFWRKVSA